MKIGTRSVLYGAHCFLLHPFFVAWGWWILYGFPWDPRLWVAFFVHDLGYLGKPNIDGPEGQEHVELGARAMAWLFDWQVYKRGPRLLAAPLNWLNFRIWGRSRAVCYRHLETWGSLCRYHSRAIAKRDGRLPSSLCWADKLGNCLEPRWMYLPRIKATGEIVEYVERFAIAHPDVPLERCAEEWFSRMRKSLREEALQHAAKRIRR